MASILSSSASTSWNLPEASAIVSSRSYLREVGDESESRPSFIWWLRIRCVPDIKKDLWIDLFLFVGSVYCSLIVINSDDKIPNLFYLECAF